MVVDAGNKGAKIDLGEPEAMAGAPNHVSRRWIRTRSSGGSALVGRSEGFEYCQLGSDFTQARQDGRRTQMQRRPSTAQPQEERRAVRELRWQEEVKKNGADLVYWMTPNAYAYVTKAC